MQRGIEAFGQWQRRPYPAFRMAQDHGEGVVQRLVLAGQVEPEESTRDGIERHPHHLRHDFDHPVRFAVPAVQHIAGGTRDGGRHRGETWTAERRYGDAALREPRVAFGEKDAATEKRPERFVRSAEHTSELPSLKRISYAAFCLTQKTT